MTDEIVDEIGEPIATPSWNASVVMVSATPASAVDGSVAVTFADTGMPCALAVSVLSNATEAVPATWIQP